MWHVASAPSSAAATASLKPDNGEQEQRRRHVGNVMPLLAIGEYRATRTISRGEVTANRT